MSEEEKEQGGCAPIKRDLEEVISQLNKAHYDKCMVEGEFEDIEKKLRNLQDRLAFSTFKLENNHFETEAEQEVLAKGIQQLENSITRVQEKYEANGSALTNITTFLEQSQQKVQQLLAEFEKCTLQKKGSEQSG